MGCCQAKPGGISKADRAVRWRSTGIVALRDSKIKELPVDVVDIAGSVRTLDATHNKLGVLPEEIGNFINLQRLILAENLLERLPSTVGKLRSLKVLTLDSNRLSLLPEEVGLLQRLERLSVSRNNLNSLPSTLGNLSNLIQLDVSQNRLETLPESIGNCKSLEELIANDNLLQELPDSVSSLSHLKTLILSDQKLKQLPPLLLRNCTALQSLMLHGTLITSEQLHQMDGFEGYEERRKRKHDKQLDANVIIDSRGFDEGVDLHLAHK
ncbi:hypothetical protein M758_11G107700 [Ceratodon purpureus]|nr:hypothetical protein M758_11G107700 [Ceratodon purpureus]